MSYCWHGENVLSESKNPSCGICSDRPYLETDTEIARSHSRGGFFAFHLNFIKSYQTIMQKFIEYTGERFMPEYFDESDPMTLAHVHHYWFSLPFVKDKKVIDLACGEGYGTNILSKDAAAITGIDIDYQTIEHARNKYGKDNITFNVGSVERINEPDESVDVLVSFETIEHVNRKQQRKFLQEVYRVLKRGGIFIVSTPDKDICGEGHNEYHIDEMNKAGFEKLLKGYFSNIEMYGEDIKAYKSRTSLFIIRVMHKLIKLDKYRIRHIFFPKKFRLKVDHSILGDAVSSTKVQDLTPKILAHNETGANLIAVCRK